MKEHIELEQIQPADIEARSFEFLTGFFMVELQTSYRCPAAALVT